MTGITATPKSIRPHLMIAEMEHESGYRYWSAPMFKVQLDLWIDQQVKLDYYLSDYCCANGCWCEEEEGL